MKSEKETRVGEVEVDRFQEANGVFIKEKERVKTEELIGKEVKKTSTFFRKKQKKKIT